MNNSHLINSNNPKIIFHTNFPKSKVWQQSLKFHGGTVAGQSSLTLSSMVPQTDCASGSGSFLRLADSAHAIRVAVAQEPIRRQLWSDSLLP